MSAGDGAPTASMLQAPQQHQSQQPGSPSPQALSAGSAGEPLVCQWQGCNQPNHSSAEVLYEHVCESHIGRKSTNNLNLQCFWGACRTTTVKRDHITSHIRVHVPLKPHKCDFCQKSFKRPQDLKKHVKTHADESVLYNSPQTGASGTRPPPNGYQVPGNEDGSYPDGASGHPMGYPYGPSQGPFHGGNGIPTQGFGVYPYGVPQASSYDNGGLTESRKRAHDTLNDFFGDAKRRNIDAGQYQDLGARFSQFLQMFAPFAGGWNGGYNPGFGGGAQGFDHSNNNGGAQYQTQAAPPMSSYNPPFPELRTKNDLMSIDQFLEQLQHTVYNNEGAASNFQPLAGMQTQGFTFPQRSSDSPPRFQGGPQAPSAATPGSSSYTSYADSSNTGDTPALTPSSFPSMHSPQASHQRGSPQSRYPQLPPINMENSNAFANAPPTSLPPSGLGSQYEDYEGRRRYSGGFLQRAQPARNEEEGIEAQTRSELSKEEKKEAGGDDGAKSESSPGQQEVKLPGVSEITQEGQESGQKVGETKDGKDEARLAWEENIKTINAMRDYIRERLHRGEFESDEGSDGGNRTPRGHQDVDMKDEETNEGQATTPKREGASLYPVLRPVEA